MNLGLALIPSMALAGIRKVQEPPSRLNLASSHFTFIVPLPIVTAMLLA